MTEHTPTLRPHIAPRIPEIGLHGRDGEYLADPALIRAANVALTLGQPLLLTGEPGCGKTDFAYVAAHALAENLDPATLPEPGAEVEAALDPRKPLECYVRSDTRARDLLYHYDPLRRFTDSHHGGKVGAEKAEDARHYVELQGLGVALTAPVLRVVLIDEIDKAPRDVPNDLLRELDRGEFEIPEIPASAGQAPVVRDRTGAALRRVMKRPDPDAPMPLVVITSNVERQLPDAFLRRCIFHHIEFPKPERLAEILAMRFGRHDDFDRSLGKRIVEIFTRTRKIDNVVKKPGTAEMLRWAEALLLFEPGPTRAHLDGFAASLDDKGRITRKDLAWGDLLAAGSLFKLREDLETANAYRA